MVPSLLASTQAAVTTGPTLVTEALRLVRVATQVVVTTTEATPEVEPTLVEAITQAVVTLLAVTPVMSTNLSRDGHPGLALSGDQPYEFTITFNFNIKQL